jgi:aspartate carbamoyltransferase regulatory subunit
MSENLLKVQPIRNGTVIDHIKPGRGRKILEVLGLSGSGTTISLLMNVPSKKRDRKDIIKVEDRELSENETEKLALLSPNARVNIIRNYDLPLNASINDLIALESPILPTRNCAYLRL